MGAGGGPTRSGKVRMSALRSFLLVLATRLSRRQKAGILLAVDAALAPLALVLLGAAKGVWPGWIVVLAVTLAALAGSSGLGLHRIKLNAFAGQAMGRTGAMAALVAAVLWLMTQGPAGQMVEFGLALVLMAAAARGILRQLLIAILRMGQRGTRVMIYGAGNTGVQLAAALHGHAQIRAVAFADDSPALQGLTMAGLRVYAPARIAAVARELQIDRVLVAMPSAAPTRIALILRQLRDLGLEAVEVPSFAQLAGAGTVAGTAGRFLGRPAVEVVAPAGAAAYAGQVVMVTGAGGSVGSELCRQVHAMGPARLVLFEMCEFALYAIERELREAGTAVEVVPVLGSVTDGRLLRDVMQGRGVAVVLHAAAYKHVPLVEANPVAGLANNVLGTRTLAEAAVDCGVRRFVLVSSDKAVRPANVMGATKRAAELVVQDIAGRAPGTAFAMVRFGNVLGSSGSVIPLFRAQIARGGPVTLTHSDVTRYFMTMDEAARLVLLAGSFAGAEGGGRHCDVFVLDMGRPVRIRDLAEQMIAAAGYTVRDAANPEGDIEIVVTGLRPGEKLHEELLIGDGLLPTPHPRILRAAERGLSAMQVASLLREVRAAVASGDGAAARAVIFDHVEGAGQTRPAVAAE